MNRRFILIAGAALLAGCATTPPPVAAPAGAGFELLEPIYAASAGPDVLRISVASNGCTRKEDFAFFVERTDSGPRIAFGRKRVDSCRSFAQGRTELAFSWTELGVDGRRPVFLLNPVTAWTGPGS